MQGKVGIEQLSWGRGTEVTLATQWKDSNYSVISDAIERWLSSQIPRFGIFFFFNILSYACLALLLLDARVLPPHMLRPLCVPRPITKVILNQLVISVLWLFAFVFSASMGRPLFSYSCRKSRHAIENGRRLMGQWEKNSYNSNLLLKKIEFVLWLETIRL